MGDAVSLQALVTALAFRYVLDGPRHTHGHIPDTPVVESERRQVFFGASIGIPTFFVHHKTRNRLMIRILENCARTRMSSRYPGYVRVYNREYREALVHILRQDAGDLIKVMDLEPVVASLEERVRNPESLSAASRITRGVLEEAGVHNPLCMGGREFNLAAEKYYRTTLKRRHLGRGPGRVCRRPGPPGQTGAQIRMACATPLKPYPPWGNERTRLAGDPLRHRVLGESLSVEEARHLIHLLLVTVRADMSEEKTPGVTKERGERDVWETHQYIELNTAQVQTEALQGDRVIGPLYSHVRTYAPSPAQRRGFGSVFAASGLRSVRPSPVPSLGKRPQRGRGPGHRPP